MLLPLASATPPSLPSLRSLRPLPSTPSRLSTQSLKERILSEKGRDRKSKDYVTLARLVAQLKDQETYDDERWRITVAMHEAGDRDDLATAASLQEELHAMGADDGAQWDGASLFEAAEKGYYGGVLIAIKHGVAVDDFKDKVRFGVLY